MYLINFPKVPAYSIFTVPQNYAIVLVRELVDYTCLRNVVMIACIWCTSCCNFEILPWQHPSESTGACEVKLFQT